MKKSQLAVLLVVFFLFSVPAFGQEEGPKKEGPKETCFMEQCWQELDVRKIGERGCPTPTLFIRNTLKELDSYFLLAEELQLTDEQLNALEDIRHKCQAKIIETRAKLQVATLKLIQQMTQDVPNRKKLEVLIAEIESLCWDTLNENAEMLARARKLITPEQRKLQAQ